LFERTLKKLAEMPDFQAEYEGSIPFTRSTIFHATLRFCAIWHAFKRALLADEPFEINLS
jgi:hypothetical protein